MSRYDYHTHSNYSDGEFLWLMVDAAEEAGLEGIGFADHCSVSTKPSRRLESHRNGFALDITYERRRQGIEALRDRNQTEVELYDAVEMDYKPEDEEAIAGFLEEAQFDYAVGSVHHLDDENVHIEPHFAPKSKAERQALVDTYFHETVALIDSELFDIAAHIDMINRNPALRGFATEEHYRRVGEALTRSRTIPEINAGRALAAYGEFHPRPEFIDVLREYDVQFVRGTDAHSPTELLDRTPALDEHFETLGLEPTAIDPVTSRGRR